jgi:hypothetical protein
MILQRIAKSYSRVTFGFSSTRSAKKSRAKIAQIELKSLPAGTLKCSTTNTILEKNSTK